MKYFQVYTRVFKGALSRVCCPPRYHLNRYQLEQQCPRAQAAYTAKPGAQLRKHEGAQDWLVFACESGDVASVQFLLKQLPWLSLDARASTNGRTALFTALENGYTKLALFLKEAGADVDVPAADGRSCFLAACTSGDEELISAVCGNVDNAQLELTDANGNTALMLACGGGRLPFVQMLVDDFGVNILAKNKQGKIAIDHAQDAGHGHIVTYLRRVQVHAEEAQAFLPRNVPLKKEKASEIGRWDAGLAKNTLLFDFSMQYYTKWVCFVFWS